MSATSILGGRAVTAGRTGTGRTVSPSTAILASCAWIASVGNIALWRHLGENGALSGPSGWLLAAGLGAAVAGALSVLISLAAWRWTLRPVLLLLFIATALSAHFSVSYGVVVDPSMVTNVLQTDRHEVFDLMSFAFARNVMLLAGLPAVAVMRWNVVHLRPREALRRNVKGAAAGFAGVALALLACFQPLASTMRNDKQARYLINPLNVIYSLGTAMRSGPARSNAVMPIGEDASIATGATVARPPLLVVVLGETGRSGNFALNGYARDTTPVLAAEDVVSFGNAWSCGTSTAASVPCMFSRMTRARFFDRDHEEEGVLDVLQHAGYAVLWVDNQSGCKGVCDRVVRASVDATAHPALCTHDECLDEALLSGLDDRLQTLDASRRQRGVVIVLHPMGSHGPAYFRRSPPAAKRFLPECTSSQLHECSRQELLNAYDNSIVYTDTVLGATIQWLKGKEPDWRPAMLYVADHGESLGEANLYLHGLPYAMAPDVQKHVPWVTWMSSGFREWSAVDWQCVNGRRKAEVRHDHFFHSLLGLMKVRSTVYDAALDAYAPCRSG